MKSQTAIISVGGYDFSAYCPKCESTSVDVSMTGISDTGFSADLKCRDCGHENSVKVALVDGVLQIKAP